MSRRALAPLFLIAATAASVPALAAGLQIDGLQNLSQHDYRLLDEDLGAALSYKPLAPGEPLGITGFDVGVGLTATSLRNTDVVQKADTTGTVFGTLPLPTLHVDKGLPYDLDVGLSVAKAPHSNVTLFGGELRWALLSGDVALPSVSLRGAATQLDGVGQLKFSTQSIDISVSKGFLVATPYGGVGEVWIHSTPQGIATLSSETFAKTRVFAGVDFHFGIFSADLELDEVGSVPSYGAKVGLRF
ncbi:MAG TPA: hypothetical protein VMU33_01670 [Burkholderiaceae bacterium]|nr:hypothetical protein [Burkholderiaceae bacterium]